MNTEPLQPIPQELIDEYHEAGVVCIRGQFDQGWIDLLLESAEQAIANPSEYGFPGLSRNPGFISLKWPSRFDQNIKRYLFDSPAAEVVGRVIGAKQVRYFNDQIFAKKPGVEQKTFWHHDAAGWPVLGEQVPSFWLTLTPVSRENSGLVVVKGSHKNTDLFWPITDQSKHMEQPKGRYPCPDFDELAEKNEADILSWDMQPGDALVIHPRAVHAAGGNASQSQSRIALTTRWFGDDIVWDPRPECVAVPYFSQDQMIKGQRPQGDDFPLMWETR